MDVNIRDELAAMVQRRWDRHQEVTVQGVVRFMYDMGWIEPVRARKAVIKDFYYQMLKHNRGNHQESRLDVQANYDVSDGYIRYVLYEQQGIK